MKVECRKVHSGWLHDPLDTVVEISVTVGYTEMLITAYPSDDGKVKIHITGPHCQLLGLEFDPGKGRE